jgi:hypothetical protein
MTVILFLARNSDTDKAAWASASLWWRNQSPKFHSSCNLLSECSELRKWHFQYVITLQIVFFCFWGQVFTRSIFSSVLHVDGVPSVRHLQQISHYYWNWTATLKLYSSHFMISRSYFQHSEGFHSIFPKFIVKLYADMLFFQVSQFVGIPKWQMEQHTLVRSSTLLNNDRCCNLIPRRWWHNRFSSLSAPSSGSLC